jgi:hypothetical protein
VESSLALSDELISATPKGQRTRSVSFDNGSAIISKVVSDALGKRRIDLDSSCCEKFQSQSPGFEATLNIGWR